MQQRTAHERVEGHHHRHRVARQPEQIRMSYFSERHRPARAHRDLPEQHFADLRHQLLGEVRLADRDAAGRDDGVGGGCSPGKCDLELSRIVAHYSEISYLYVEASEHPMQGVAVGVVDLAFLQRGADGGELVAGREERDAQLTLDAYFGEAERSDEP